MIHRLRRRLTYELFGTNRGDVKIVQASKITIAGERSADGFGTRLETTASLANTVTITTGTSAVTAP